MNLVAIHSIQQTFQQALGRIRLLGEQSRVPMVDLFTLRFLTKYTNVSSIEELLGKSGFVIRSDADFYAVPTEQWNDYIRSVSVFRDWKSMVARARQEWVQREIYLQRRRVAA